MNYEELVKLYEQAEEEYDVAEVVFNKSHEKDKEFPPYEVFNEYMKPYKMKIHQLLIKMVGIAPIVLKDIEDGHYMSLDSFKTNCEYGAFIDYDGFGLLCVGKKQTDIEMYPSYFKHNVDLSRFDGILWFNK